MKIRTSLTVAGAALALAVTPAASASAAPSFDPSSPKTANPAQTCAFVASYAEKFGVSTGSSHSECVRDLAGTVPSVPFGNPADSCAEMEAAGMITYPYAFYAEGGPFPGLVAHDRKQCARAIWAFHTLAGLAGGPA